MDGWGLCTLPAVVWYDLLSLPFIPGNLNYHLDRTRFAQRLCAVHACDFLLMPQLGLLVRIMRGACVRLCQSGVADAAIGIACAQAFRQDAAHTTLAESRWASWIWFVEDRSWPYFPPCALDYTFVYCQSGVRVVGAYLR